MLPLTRYPYRGEVCTCPVCRSADATPVSGLDRRLKRLKTMACRGCGLFYTNPMPTSAELERYYRDYYRFDYQWSVSGPNERRRRKRRKEADTRSAHVLGLLPAGARTLDFGAGSGEFVSAMLDAGFDAHGFEPGEDYGGYARGLHGDRISIATWQKMEYSEPFDMISAFHVLEHLADPVAAIRKAAGWLKPDGLFYIEVPDMVASYTRKAFGAFHFAHLVGFNHYNLCLAAAEAGLHPVKVIAGTGVIFSKAPHDTDREALGALGSAETRRMLDLVSPGRTFLQHSFFRFGKRLRTVVSRPLAAR
ncbi:class I SAM-dependent methyltransferase [Rhizobiaceae bacterium BDR2-2]|uniref:Class I SAM-dependent methyltransferase n=1 Tax=Ectorhizobium quercum TaxID=2965071 RepID=A0AAE3MZ49_9HYPH|nr:class I SAM-dependent methyltransferase [Ectorhizobium quercum]MCX8997032.1 class I SAM-dependent methyltransferase [Ectorhizobium quercum]